MSLFQVTQNESQSLMTSQRQRVKAEFCGEHGRPCAGQQSQNKERSFGLGPVLDPLDHDRK